MNKQLKLISEQKEHYEVCVKKLEKTPNEYTTNPRETKILREHNQGIIKGLNYALFVFKDGVIKN